jgi:chromosome segregation ATPase
MKLKLKAPSLSTGKRAALEKTAKWLINLLTDLETRKALVEDLNQALREAESRKNQFEKSAARNSDAAAALAGAETQLSRLAPEVKQAQESLENKTVIAIRQVNLVRSSELRELLFGPLTDQLRTAIATAIAPFFAPDWARQNANQIMQHQCNPYGHLMFYLNRQPSVTTDFDTAKREINALVSEIETILAGGTLLEA